MNKIKFKYLAFRHTFFDVDELREQFTEVENPLPYNNLPDGEYLIRGNKKSHRKYYWKFENLWFLSEDVIKDNGHYHCDATRYLLFPSLSEKEWKYIALAGWKRLTPFWQRCLHGYEFWMELNKSRKNMKLDHIQFFKDLKDE